MAASHPGESGQLKRSAGCLDIRFATARCHVTGLAVSCCDSIASDLRIQHLGKACEASCLLAMCIGLGVALVQADQSYFGG